MSLFGKLTAKQFLRGHWQKQPLLVRQAFPDLKPPLSPEELAGLACEDEIESRLVIRETNATCPWQLRRGPFNEQDFTQLNNNNWTLLVQDCQRYVEAAAELLQPFDFIPRWRVDDVMISFATEGGSVGPHIDQYDVFLIQVQGERRWQLDRQAVSENNLYPDCELDILQHFNADDEWVLSPGDMLYLPPRLAHYGVALNDCMTISVGFRAPSHQEMVIAYLEQLVEQANQQDRFSDPHRGLPENPTEIEVSDIEQFSELLQRQLQDTNLLHDVFGRLVTEHKHPEDFVSDISMDDIDLDKGISIDPDARLAFIREHYYHIRLFVNGNSLEAIPPAAHLVPRLCEQGYLAASDYQEVIDSDEFRQLIGFLLACGVITNGD